MKKKSPQLRDGSEWADHEDCIVGDEEGIKNLIKACESALSDGEYYGSDLGDYVGVKKLEADWFIDPMDSTPTRIGNFILKIVLLILLALIVVGFFTTIQWLF